MNARFSAGERFKPSLAVLAFILFLALPIGIQSYVVNITEQAISSLVNGTDQSAEHAIRQLEAFGPILDTDSLVWRFDKAETETARNRLAGAYLRLTGNDIRQRLAQLLD